ncbi:MAG: amidohydrolase family protein, partial [Bacteroidota bacterium]
HTHILLQGDVTAEDYDEQLLKESTPYRTIRAVVAVKTALENGFTTMRDMETEGAMYADVDVKRAINRGIIPGPRLFVSTRSLDITGAYPLVGYSWELHMPKGVQVVDGVDECRKAVREQIEHGADWIKLYADRSYFIGTDGALHSIPTFTIEELKAIVDEAHRLHRKVAAHAIGHEGIMNSLTAGVNSIEHGDGFDDETIAMMVKQGVYWCPTMYVGVYVAEGRAVAGNPIWKQMIDIEKRAVGKGVKAGAKIAFGTDVGGFPWTENQAKEFKLMVDAGLTPMQAIKAATMVASEMLGMQDKLGSIEPGKFADIVAVPGEPLSDVTVLEHVGFVMKEGKVYKDAIAK